MIPPNSRVFFCLGVCPFLKGAGAGAEDKVSLESEDKIKKKFRDNFIKWC